MQEIAKSSKLGFFKPDFLDNLKSKNKNEEIKKKVTIYINYEKGNCLYGANV